MGSWAALLSDMATPYTGPLSELLGRSLPPEHDDLLGAEATSDRLCDLLHESIDPAARRFERWIAHREALCPKVRPADPAAAARAALHELGVNI